MLSHLSVAALAVAGGAAIMIPPNVALESISKPGISAILTDPFSIKLLAPCKGCEYAEFNDETLTWTKDVENSLFLDVAVGSKLNTLQLNGVQIYPPLPPQALTTDVGIPSIAQVPSTVSLKDVERNSEKYLAHPLKLTSWGLEATTVHSLKETGEEIIKVELSIGALEGKSVRIPDILITALKNPEVQMMVLNVELQENTDKNCHGMPLLCKWKGVIEDMTKSIKGKMRGKCHKARPHHISAAEQHKEEELEKPKPHRRPHHGVHHHGHKGHHRQHGMHRVLHKVARVLLTIVIPLLLGILAGMLAYAVGMLLGTFIALVWMRVRRIRNNYQPIALEDDEESRKSFEKGEFQEEVFVEAPPVYVEVEAKEVGRQE